MKRFIAVFAVLATLIFVLAACNDTNQHSGANSGNGNNPGTNADNGAGTGNAGGGAGSADGSITDSSGAASNGASAASYRGGDVGGNLHNAYNESTDATIFNGRSMTRYEMMLDNARVRDTDGNLFDGENAHHNTFF